MRGDTQGAYHLSSPGQLSAEVGTVSLMMGWLPKRHRVGPSASLDESFRLLLPLYIMQMVACQIKIHLTFACFAFRLTSK